MRALISISRQQRLKINAVEVGTPVCCDTTELLCCCAPGMAMPSCPANGAPWARCHTDSLMPGKAQLLPAATCELLHAVLALALAFARQVEKDKL